MCKSSECHIGCIYDTIVLTEVDLELSNFWTHLWDLFSLNQHVFLIFFDFCYFVIQCTLCVIVTVSIGMHDSSNLRLRRALHPSPIGINMAGAGGLLWNAWILQLPQVVYMDIEQNVHIIHFVKSSSIFSTMHLLIRTHVSCNWSWDQFNRKRKIPTHYQINCGNP